MKKVVSLALVTFMLFSASLSLAQTTSTETPTTTLAPTNSKQFKKGVVHKVKGVKDVVSSVYKNCLNLEMKDLTKEMQTRKKKALSEYKNALRSATSTEAKKEAKKAYTNSIKEINKWFTNAVKEAKEKCKSVATSTTPTSTATSTQ